jgi:hypothetical protein
MNPDQWAAHQQHVQSLEESKRLHDKMLEEKEGERLRLMAEKGQIEQAFKEMRTTWEQKQQETQARLVERERAWLNERRTQVINEVMTGRSFVGADEQARVRTANMVRRLLEQEIEAVIGPDGAPDVRHRSSLRPARDYLLEKFTSPDSELSVLLAPSRSSGGAGTDGTRPPANPNNTPPEPGSIADQVAKFNASRNSAWGLAPIGNK